jgi:hypothetical protein
MSLPLCARPADPSLHVATRRDLALGSTKREAAMTLRLFAAKGQCADLVGCCMQAMWARARCPTRPSGPSTPSAY